MTRNSEIQKIFENADDSLQGVLGYHFYVLALNHSVKDSNDLRVNLPHIKDKSTIDAFPLTFSWIRYYRREDLINSYNAPFLELYQSRMTLIAMVSVFDDFLSRVITELKSLGHNLELDSREFDENKQRQYKN